MEWWIWLLIALGLLLVIGLVVFLVVRTQQKPAPATLVKSSPEGTTLIRTGEPAFDPDAARAAYQAEMARRRATEAERLASRYALSALAGQRQAQ